MISLKFICNFIEPKLRNIKNNFTVEPLINEIIIITLFNEKL